MYVSNHRLFLMPLYSGHTVYARVIDLQILYNAYTDTYIYNTIVIKAFVCKSFDSHAFITPKILHFEEAYIPQRREQQFLHFGSCWKINYVYCTTNV